ncbi:unnamed protein product [Acanthoscelides obtectus]|uniref:Uncharacterized protein n=1 Tax=Acanthoscelides obtectus TaxID=200917 RepID=A0A9P0K4F6_ACAOB|nr:unnamed protein product [Acanthoscelides obtectus]CAK1653215.1 hypothetical protein AOBTE_LOCUS18129 [Acanthoscelides obtectus]
MGNAAVRKPANRIKMHSCGRVVTSLESFFTPGYRCASACLGRKEFQAEHLLVNGIQRLLSYQIRNVPSMMTRHTTLRNRGQLNGCSGKF